LLFKAVCENRLSFLFIFKVGDLQEPFWVLNFSKEKQFGFQAWWFLAI
jgi:hypothetical protein